MTTDSIEARPPGTAMPALPQAGKRAWWVVLAMPLAALLSAAMVLPAYHELPPPGMERGLPALITPSPLSGRYLYPWLLDMDRRLLLFGGLALFCKLCAQLLFPALLASRAANAMRVLSASPASLGDTLWRQLKAVWRPWLLASLCLLLVGGSANLIAIRQGIAPSFPSYPRHFTFGQDIVMALIPLLSLPFSGLLIGALSVGAGAVLRRPLPAILAAYALVLVIDLFAGMAALDLANSINEFIPPPGLVRWSAPAVLLNASVYGLMSGLIAALAWYFAVPSAAKGREPASAETAS